MGSKVISLRMCDWSQTPNLGNVGRVLACAVFCAVYPVSHPANAQTFLEDMQLVGIGGSGQSSIADGLGRRTGGLSDGSRYSYNPYYTTNFRDLRVTMLSPINRNFGIVWGFGTGESGDKYQIDPSVKLGFVATEPVGEAGLLSFSMSGIIGGYFREGTCRANYGAIGGTQTVNCRMADSTLSPDDTLNYLVNQRPSDQLTFSLRYQLQF